MVNLPAESSIPAIPATWYLFGSSAEARARPVSKDMLSRRLVAFRTERGEFSVLDAKCAHLSADLGRGRVVGECVECPFHQWQYGVDGRCVQIPAQANIPSFARQRAYPTIERHGLIYFFAGREARFPLPFFEGCDPDGFRRGRPFHFSADLAWPMLVANGFDEQHFRSVHDRRLLAPPRVHCPTPHSRQINYRAEVVGDSIYDRILRRTAGREVEISITSHGGPLVLVTGAFQRAKSYVMISVHSRADYEIDASVTVFAPRSRKPLLRGFGEWLALEVRRLFTRGFMERDITSLGGIRYNPRTMIDADYHMREFFVWLATLPAESHEPVASKVSGSQPEPIPSMRSRHGESVFP